MQVLENFIISPIAAKPRPGLEEELLEKVLTSYEKTTRQNSLVRALKWLLPIPVVVAFSLLVFVKVSGEVSSRREVSMLDQQSNQMETQITNDPVLNDVLNLPSN